MKVQMLFEMALPQAPMAKMKKLKAKLTPELVTQNYETVLQMLAAKCTAGELDEFIATLTGEIEDGKQIDFYFALFLKKLPANTNPKMRTHGQFPSVSGQLKDTTNFSKGSLYKKRFYEISYRHAKWFVDFYSDNPALRTNSRKFEKPEDALTYALKTIDVWQNDTDKLY